MSAPAAQRHRSAHQGAHQGAAARAAAAPRRGPGGARLAQAGRHLVLGAVVGALVAVVAVVSLRVGSFTLSYQEIIETLLGGGTKASRLLILTWRLPRILLAIAAGAALAVAGQLFQVVTRNPLGSPDLIGFTMGAQTGILLSVLVLPAGLVSTSLASFLGGLSVGAVILLVSLRGGFTGLRLILAGIAISSMLASLNRWMLLRVEDEDLALGALKAVTGTLSAATWQVVAPTTVGIVVLLAAVLPLVRPMQMLPLGEDMAAALGTRVRGLRIMLVLAGTALVALVTVAAGPIGFIALIAPHLARSLARAEVPPLYLSGAVGALLLLSSDVVSQVILDSLPVGVATAAIGGTYLMGVLTLGARRGRA